MRKLASIQYIHRVDPIPEADSIECLSVLGWKVVAKKGDFKVGDSCVYCEIDSVLPNSRQEFEFLKNCGFRIKTRKFRSQISQGICFSLSILPERAEPYCIGEDVTEILGITLYEPVIPAQLRGKVLGQFPSDVISKTDEIRIQSEPELINEIMGLECYISTKIDGTSSTYLVHPNTQEFVVCSRNLQLCESEENLYWRIARELRLKDKLGLMSNYAIQGEIAGPGIQKNPLRLNRCELFVFNVIDLSKRHRLDYVDFVNFCNDNGLQIVPIEEVCTFNFTMEQLLQKAEGNYKTGNRKEGIVIRPTVSRYSPTLQSALSFKVINNQYLLKNEE